MTVEKKKFTIHVRRVPHGCESGEMTEYFFSTHHTQPTGGDFVAVSYVLPMRVVRRSIVPDGWVRTLSQLIQVFYNDGTEIPNPDPRYQLKFG